MIRADLHMHSRVSDGSDTIEELAREAAAAGLDLSLIHISEPTRP